MKYLEPSFSTMAPPGEEYRDNWEKIFGKKETPSQLNFEFCESSDFDRRVAAVEPEASTYDVPCHTPEQEIEALRQIAYAAKRYICALDKEGIGVLADKSSRELLDNSLIHWLSTSTKFR